MFSSINVVVLCTVIGQSKINKSYRLLHYLNSTGGWCVPVAYAAHIAYCKSTVIYVMALPPQSVCTGLTELKVNLSCDVIKVAFPDLALRCCWLQLHHYFVEPT